MARVAVKNIKTWDENFVLGASRVDAQLDHDDNGVPCVSIVLAGEDNKTFGVGILSLAQARKYRAILDGAINTASKGIQ